MAAGFPVFSLPNIITAVSNVYLPQISYDAKGRLTAVVASPFIGTGNVVLDSVLAGYQPLFTAQTANTILAGPTSGAAATPAFRTIVSADINTALLTPGPIGTTPSTGQFTTLYVGVTGGPVATELTVINTSAADPRGILSGQYSNDALGSRIHLRKARGTPAVPTTITTGDVLGRIRFSGYDGANFIQSGSIDVVSTGTVASTRVPTYMAFSVGTDAAPSVLTERMRITAAGALVLTPGIIAPSADSTTALRFTKADGSTNVMVLDTTNARVGINVTPLDFLHIVTSVASTGIRVDGPNVTGPAVRVNNTHATSSNSRFVFAGRGSDKWTFGSDSAGDGSQTFFVYDNVAGGYRIFINPSGNVGLGGATSFGTNNRLLVNPYSTTIDAATAMISPGANDQIGLVIQAKSGGGQTADLFQTMNSGGSLFTSISASGVVTSKVTGGTTTSVVNTLIIDNESAVTPASGFGTSILFAGKDNGTANVSMGRVRTSWTNATNLSQTSQMVLSVYNVASEVDVLSLAPTTITLLDTINIILGTTTGTKIGTATSQKLALWNATPDVQPTTAIVAATFVANTSGIANDTATWGGYTGGQVVAALKRLGALA